MKILRIYSLNNIPIHHITVYDIYYLTTLFNFLNNFSNFLEVLSSF